MYNFKILSSFYSYSCFFSLFFKKISLYLDKLNLQKVNKGIIICRCLNATEDMVHRREMILCRNDHEYLLKFLLVGDSDVGKNEITDLLGPSASESPGTGVFVTR